MQVETHDWAHRRNQRTRSQPPVIVASCRAPVAPVRRRGKLAWQNGTGGLVRVLEPALGRGDRWVAAAEPGLATASDLRKASPTPYEIRYVPLERKTWRLFSAACNRILWMALHGVSISPSLRITDILTMWESGYRTASRIFANVVAAEWERRPAPIFLQDYHLFGCASELRRRLPEARIALFCHTPFPESPALQSLPQFVTLDLLDGLRSVDLIGFQTERDVARFRQAGANFRRSLSDSRREKSPKLEVFPATVDSEGVLSDAVPPDRDPYRFWEKDVSVITWAGRSDPVKNPTGALDAFQLLLDEHPSLRGRVRLLLKVQPSRQTLPEYRLCLLDVQRKAAEVNSIYASGQWVPVVLDLSPERANLTAALSKADVLLVNSLADGMNLVVQEGILLSENAAVVLSTTTGAYEQLRKEVIGVDPRDLKDVAGALDKALSIPLQERAARQQRLRRTVLQSNPRTWMEAQIDALQKIRSGDAPVVPEPADSQSRQPAHDRVLRPDGSAPMVIQKKKSKLVSTDTSDLTALQPS